METLWILMWVAIGALIGYLIRRAMSGKKPQAKPQESWGPPRPRRGPPPRPATADARLAEIAAERGWHPSGSIWKSSEVSITTERASGNINVEISGSNVKFSKDGEVIYEGPLDDAPDEVVRAVSIFKKGMGRFSGSMGEFRGLMDDFGKQMDKFGEDMDKFGEDMRNLKKD